MRAKTVFTFIVLEHAEPRQDAQGNDVTPDSVVLVPITTVVATDENHARLIASKAIPDGANLKNVEVLVRRYSHSG